MYVPAVQLCFAYYTLLTLLFAAAALLVQLLAMMRIGVLAGGVETPDALAVPPSQKLVITQVAEEAS
jgi:hypothetical protein